ncbi:hypothetical protein P5673_018205 [Acropora cervicornis]|uniref:Uncharacterized protein n=1 Tax=Acropora cervicornis TaxID=6130 RepID=A0AAD9QD44_ACRCE|nr:hypothetical protein P5673_018205 [Acropora cervicornis]
MLNTPLRGLSVPCVPLGFYGIHLRQHPRAQLISDAAGLDDIPDRFGGSRVKHVGIHGIEYRPECVLRLHGMDDLENDYPVYDKWMRLLFGKTRNFSF